MNWLPLAHKEFDELIRSKALWAFSVVLLFGYYVSLTPSSTVQQAVGSAVVIGAFQNPVRFLVPIAATLLSYRSIIGECESGSIKFVAGMPQRRDEILLGKVLGRSAALGVPVLVFFVIGVIIGTAKYGGFSLSDSILFLSVSELYVLVNISIGTGFSAVVARSRRAFSLVILYYSLLILNWNDFVSNRIYTLLTGTPVEAFSPPASTVLFFWRRLSPVASYDVLTNAILGVGNSDGSYTSVVYQLQPYKFTNVFIIQDTFDRPVPFYLAEWFPLVLLGCWIGVSLFLGDVWFSRADVATTARTHRSGITNRIGRRLTRVLSMKSGRTTHQRLPSLTWPSESWWSWGFLKHSSPTLQPGRRFTRWLPLARKEFATTIRYRSLWVFVVLLLLGAYLTSTPPTYVFTALGSDVTIAAFQVPLWFLLPFFAVIASYRSIVSERETGSIKFVVGMPQSRSEVIFGKIAGRTAAVGVFVLGAICLFLIVEIPSHGLVSPGMLALFGIVSVGYLVTNVSLATGVSAMMDRSVQAATVVFGYLIVFNPYIWLIISIVIDRQFPGVQTVPTGSTPPADGLLFLTRRLSPFESYTVLTNAVFGVGNSDEAYYTVLRELQPGKTPGYIVGDVFARPIPYYLSEWFPLLVLLVWTLLPVSIGYLVFRRSDLG